MATEAPLPITTLTEEEEMLKQSVATFAREKVAPLVRTMDRDAEMPRSLITSMHEQGTSELRTGKIYAGAGLNR